MQFKDHDKCVRIYGPVHTDCDDPEGCEFDHDEMDETKAFWESPDAESIHQKKRQDVYCGATNRRDILEILKCDSIDSKAFRRIMRGVMKELCRIGYFHEVTTGPRNIPAYRNAFKKYHCDFAQWLFQDGAKYAECDRKMKPDFIDFVRVKALNMWFDGNPEDVASTRSRSIISAAQIRSARIRSEELKQMVAERRMMDLKRKVEERGAALAANNTKNKKDLRKGAEEDAEVDEEEEEEEEEGTNMEEDEGTIVEEDEGYVSQEEEKDDEGYASMEED